MAGLQRLPLRRRVIVALRDGSSIRGVLLHRRRDSVVLVHAELLQPKAAPVTLDGQVLVLAERVEFVQIIPAES